MASAELLLEYLIFVKRIPKYFFVFGLKAPPPISNTCKASNLSVHRKGDRRGRFRHRRLPLHLQDRRGVEIWTLREYIHYSRGIELEGH
jgi:hypothetical protein